MEFIEAQDMYDNRLPDETAELLTIGYEGASIDDFVETLRAAGISKLVDIRELPLSRKKGFSKRALCKAVTEVGIEYEHVRSLGDPKPGRDAAKSGNLDEFRRIFFAHLETEPAQLAINDLISIAPQGRICLLCFERSHKHCHRKLVTDEVVKRSDIVVRHIGVQHGIARETSR